MTSWHELSRLRGSFSRYSADHRTRQNVRRSETDPSMFEAYYVRQQNKGLFPPPEECVELWPMEPILARTVEEAVEQALRLLEIAAGGAQDGLFEFRPCPIPLSRKKVREILSPTHRAGAYIYQHTESRYEVRYFGDIVGSDYEEGWRLSVPVMEGEVVPPDFEWLTLADDLSEAEKIAALELDRIIADGKIKLK